MDAHKKAAGERLDVTDDASLVEKYGNKVAVAVGSYSNLKVTSPEDIPIFEYFLRQENRIKLAQANSKKPRQRSSRSSRPSRSSRRRRRSKRR
jgi:hypothetical protein